MSDYILLGGTYLRANSTLPTLEMHKQAKLRDYGDSKIVSMTEIKIPSQANLANAVASYCVLYWCVNTYSATVRSHTLFENVTDTWHDANAQINMIQPGESRLDLQPPREDNLTQFSFTISGRASSTIGGWLKDKMEISNVPNTHCYGDRAGMGSSMDIPTEFLLPMLRSSLTDIFESLANGMTARVRQLGWSAQNDTPSAGFGPVEGIGAANGTSFIVETQIHVRWAWVILPCLLLILTMAFLGITIFETRKKGLEAWKSSPIALVRSGLDDNVQQEIRAARDPVKMEELAADIPVRLRRCESDAPSGYWKLESS
ncbi:hypothetical protein SI65_08242 [Aspergillus cristatus]|uniref:Uncharacterized protein n=1 Tax=Aspergillus cristatus TaxID=573508 RepID=A0A1E3B5L2_ASPCR|nr:hypothetical protein SI65_08242 [Aspergillus cristatus]